MTRSVGRVNTMNSRVYSPSGRITTRPLLKKATLELMLEVT